MKVAIEYVELTNHETGEITYLSVDEVVVNHGYESDITLFENSPLQIEFANEHYIKAGVAHR